MSPTRRTRLHAFTLIELLIVIAILGVLASVLFPVFGQSRRARDSSCLSGGKEISHAFLMYAQDYDDTTVPSAWRAAMSPYVDERRLEPCPLGDAALVQRHLYARGREPRDEDGGVSVLRVRTPNMTYHGGKIMPTSNTTAIFWGTTWTSTDEKVSGIDSFYQGFNNSNYATTSDEYTGTNGQVGAQGMYNSHIIDTTAASGGGSTSTILAEVCKAITNPDPSGNGYYPVYTDRPRGSAGYCAYHSAGTCHGVPVQFGFFWKLDGDAGCDPQDTSGLHSEGLAALANVSAHELSEARTDPASPGAWYDSSGSENGDKCAWTFGAPLVTLGSEQWKLQGEWSNNAYNARTGYPNSSGQRGCLSGL